MRHLALVLRERGLTINFTGTIFSTLDPCSMCLRDGLELKMQRRQESDDGSIIMQGLVETSVSACFECGPQGGRRCKHRRGQDQRGKRRGMKECAHVSMDNMSSQSHCPPFSPERGSVCPIVCCCKDPNVQDVS